MLCSENISIIELLNLKKLSNPYFTTNLLPEEHLSICIPLAAPFNRFAISHTGTIFQYAPLKTLIVDNLENKKEMTIDPSSIIVPKFLNGYQCVVLQDKFMMYRKSFFVHRLVLNRFCGLDIYEKCFIGFRDEDRGNPSILNLLLNMRKPSIVRLEHGNYEI